LPFVSFVFLELMNIVVLVASHKQYWMPRQAPYLPIEVGADLKEPLALGGVRDNQGENISRKNFNYCELTALYWAWKNLREADAVGLVHYRRHFGKKPLFGTTPTVFALADYEKALKKAPVLVPPKRNYFIETVRSQYEHAHNPADLKVLRDVIAEDTPEYLPAFNRVMEGTTTHIYNMFVMKRPYLDAYCEWLFAVLKKVENRIDCSTYDQYEARVFGFLAERMLDVWLITNSVPTAQLPVVQLERTNWIKKGSSFLWRKFFAGHRTGKSTSR
jgi:hypothetical protein